jgi:hypothetical protein
MERLGQVGASAKRLPRSLVEIYDVRGKLRDEVRKCQRADVRRNRVESV